MALRGARRPPRDYITFIHARGVKPEMNNGLYTIYRNILCVYAKMTRGRDGCQMSKLEKNSPLNIELREQTYSNASDFNVFLNNSRLFCLLCWSIFIVQNGAL